jgi:ribonucleotide reductase beta subunit family protein with ferritin-like domain
MEKILTSENSRFLIFPVDPEYQDLWDLYITHLKAFWVHDEIDYRADIDDWKKLDECERHFIEYILAFFASSDGIVLENLVSNFASEVKISEARAFYAFQGMIENIHATVYALLLDTLVTDNKKKKFLFNAIEEIPVVKKKADWTLKWMNDKKPFGMRLAAFAVVEGIFFSGSFCSIFWLKDQNKMVKALGHSNELIARDEGLHVQFAVALFNHLKNKPSSVGIEIMFREAVTLENEFICEAIPCDMIGMNKKMMKDYVQFVADRLLVQLGYGKIYKTKNPFDFMDKIGLVGKTNFFEKRVSEYQISGNEKINESVYNLDQIDF